MRLLDSSAWIEYLRDTGGRAAEEVARLLADPEDLATTEPLVMELLAGAVDDRALRSLETLTSGLVVLPVDPAVDFHDAAAIHRAARRRGVTVRRLNDCLIAAIALRHDVRLVHRDHDFEVIAAVSPLKTQSLI